MLPVEGNGNVCLCVCMYTWQKLKPITTSIEIYKYTKVITNKNKCTYNTQKNKTHWK